MSDPPPSTTTISVALPRGGKGMKRLLGGSRAEQRLTLTPNEIVVEHEALIAPLRFAPGSVAVATIDDGPAQVSGARGRFPVLHRLAVDRIVPREEGIEGWLWTSEDGSAFIVLGDEAPNVAFVFSPPVAADRLEGVFPPDMLADVARRSPLGEPALFGLVLRAENLRELERGFDRYGFRRELTDREVPPTQRRHLLDDKPANPTIEASRRDRAATSVAPPGFG